MPRTFADALGWVDRGNHLLDHAVAGLSDAAFDEPSLLPGWNRRHVVAHVAANAEALGHLMAWAATGVETPMYVSMEARAAGIEEGAARPVIELRVWLAESAAALGRAMADLPADRWQAEVRTAQGRLVPASEVAWMRAREVCVHAVDLAAGVGFADLPEGFCAALSEEILAKRGLDGLPPQVSGAPLAETTAWLAGRPHTLSAAPELGPWL